MGVSQLAAPEDGHRLVASDRKRDNAEGSSLEAGQAPRRLPVIHFPE